MSIIESRANDPGVKTEFKDVDQEWADFKTKFNKNYETEDEEKRRFEIFKQALEEITAHNKKYITGEISWAKGIDQFSDMTPEEFNKFLSGSDLIK